MGFSEVACIFKYVFFNSALINTKTFFDVTYSFLINTLVNTKIIKTPTYDFSGKEFLRVYALFEEMLTEYSSKQEGYIDYLKANLTCLVLLILRAMKKDKQEYQGMEKNQMLQNAVNYIHDNFYKDITLEELSMQAFLSRSHFCRLFKKYSGKTAKEFIQEIRINEACRLLQNTEKKIADIAFEVGYNDIKYFNSLFERITGETPNIFRKKHRGKSV